MIEVLVDVFGIKTELHTDISEFAHFVKQNYFCFVRDKLEFYDIQVFFSASAGRNAAKAKKNMMFVGNGMYLGNSKIYWENEFGFRVLLKCLHKDKWILFAFHDDLLRTGGTEGEKYENFQRSMRWTIHFPIFVLLQLRQGKSILHASAVEKDRNAVVICGFNKVGKSTLAVYLSKMKGYKFMTDNFLFFDENKFYGFPERLRMDTASLKALDINEYDNLRIYGKHHVDLDRTEICLSANPHVFFFITKGNEIKVSKMESNKAIILIDSMNNHLKEFPEYSYLTLLPFLGIYYKEKSKRVSHILNKTKCFNLKHSNDWKLSQIAEVIEKCI